MNKKEMMFLISEVERTLRINNSYILGTNLSKKKYKELKKEFLILKHFNHFETKNLLTVLFYYRNKLLHLNSLIDETFLCKKYFRLIYNVDEKNKPQKKDIENIIMFFLSFSLAKKFENNFPKNMLSNYTYTSERLAFFNENYDKINTSSKEDSRRLRNYLFHGYSSGETNRDGYVFR